MKSKCLNCSGEQLSRLCWKTKVLEDGKVASFQHVAEMLDGLVDRQQLSIVCTVFLLGLVHLFGEECERLPGVVHELL
jgi:hypothetical protein